MPAMRNLVEHLARRYLKENCLLLCSAVWRLDTTSLSLFTPRSEEVPAHEIQAIRLGIGRWRKFFHDSPVRSGGARIVTETYGDGRISNPAPHRSPNLARRQKNRLCAPLRRSHDRPPLLQPLD